MATDIKISQMPSAASLEGTELIPIVQGGTNKTTTPNKIKEGLATVTQLNNKVDKDGNKVLSEQNFTTKLKSKLDGIEAEANKYEHPANHPASIITQDATHRFVTDVEKATWNGKANTADIPDVSGFATKGQLNTKVDKDGSKVLSEKNFTVAYETKLKGIADNANNYVHPTGNGNNHIPQGGAEGQFLGYSAAGTAKWVNAPTASVSVATSAALGGIKIGYTQSDKNYPIVLDSDGKAYVIVPWTDTVYTHPTTAGNKHIPAGGSSGQILKWSTAGTAVWGAEKTYSDATSNTAGLMSAADKAKLDGIATQANKYVLPAAGASIGGVKQGVAVEDATSADDIITTVNALLVSLRTSGAIATASAAAATYSVMAEDGVIDFVPPMIIERGKLYKEDEIIYECIQTSKLPISNKLKDLVGYYVK